MKIVNDYYMANPCYNCGKRRGLYFIKLLSGYYLIKCENCMVYDDEFGGMTHPMQGGWTIEQAVKNWNEKSDKSQLLFDARRPSDSGESQA